MGLFRHDLPKPECWPPPRDAESVRAALAYVRRHDPWGHQVHTVLALLHLFTLPLAPAPSAVTFALLTGYAALRLPHTWRCYSGVLRMPIAWCTLALIGWTALTLSWSRDPIQGLDEVTSYRMLLLPLLLWPIIDRAPWLIGAALVGVAAQNLVQFSQGMELFGMSSEEGRLRGLVHPIKTGAWCAAAMCWHAVAVLRSERWLRWVSIAGLLLAAAGLVLSGSRGPWIAVLLVLLPGLAIIALLRPQLRAMCCMTIGAAIIGGVIFAVAFRDRIEPRYERAVTEVVDAIEDDVYITSAGLRVALWQWAWEIFRDAPIAGAGAGSYRIASSELSSYQRALERWPDHQRFLSRDHAHSTHLQVLANTGLIGFVLLWAVLIVALRQAWRDPPNHPYADAMLLVIAAWIIGAQFDAYHMTSQLSGMLGLAIALTLPGRAPARYALAADDAPNALEEPTT